VLIRYEVKKFATISLTTTGTHMPYGISVTCHPAEVMFPTFIPAN